VSILQRGMAWMHNQMRVHAGETVTYRRGGVSSVTLTAVAGQSFEQRVGPDQQAVEVRVQDWLVKAGDLVLDGMRVEPERMDTICRTLPDGSAELYQVQPLAGVRCYELSDSGRDTLRIHTKLIKGN
jgi:hypothetical protein